MKLTYIHYLDPKRVVRNMAELLEPTCASEEAVTTVLLHRIFQTHSKEEIIDMVHKDLYLNRTFIENCDAVKN